MSTNNIPKMLDKSNKLIKFTNCRILRNHKIIRDDLWVRNGKIINPEKVFFDEKRAAHITYDCKNSIIAPGFIELQINGELKIILLLDFLQIYRRRGQWPIIYAIK